ncbi:MAG: hypothetical protein KDD45_01690 [Bdellovibrionales bacterium]|nr:hypothetical protein [Bdellovibrionales bacterium]
MLQKLKFNNTVFKILVPMILSFNFIAHAEDNDVNTASENQAIKENEFSVPTYFEPGQGVLFPNQVFEYDLNQDQGGVLEIGNIKINKRYVFVDIRMAKYLSRSLVKLNLEGLSFSFNWPEGLFNNPLIEIISGKGDVIWKKQITSDDMNSWQKKLNSWKDSSGLKDNNKALHRFPFNSNYVLTEDSSFDKASKKLTRAFRICISEKNNKASSRYCSPRAIVRKNRLIYSKKQSKTRVIVQNEEAVTKNEIEVAAGVPFSFYAELKGGESYEFISEPSKLNLVDVVQAEAGKIKVIGFGVKPIQKVTILNKEEVSTLVKFFGFESTIKEEREFWQVTIPESSSYLFFPGTGGGVFKQRINSSIVPKSQSRIFLYNRTPESSYDSNVRILGKKMPEAKVSSKSFSTEPYEKSPTDFIWHFKADNKGEINKSYLTVNYEGKDYPSFYEVYRAYANELSARFTGVLSSSGQVILGEVLYTRWFEALMGHNSFSFQRWGLAAKYFNSLNKLKVSDTENAPLSVSTIDFKYRFTPGVWTRDETSGAMLSYQDISFGNFKAPMLGAGWFWARSMPRVFDNIINFIPFMRYPKWVDMEVIYYFNSLSSKITLNSPLSVNFHGQILWTKSFFGEAGFGLKRYAFSDKELNQKAELNTFYGTVGLGLKF